MKQSAEIALLAKALIAMQSEVKAVVKDASNPHYKSWYASLDAITEYARPLLAKHRLAVLQGGGDLTNGGLMVETTLVHESGQWISSSFELPIEKPTPQSAGSAITYGRRYGLAALLALTTEEDDDGNAASAQKPIARAQTVPGGELTGSMDSQPRNQQAQAIDGASVKCPECGGKMWDNRIGKKNPKAPDFKCRDKSCDGVIWPDKPKNGQGTVQTAGAGPGLEDVPFDEVYR